MSKQSVNHSWAESSHLFYQSLHCATEARTRTSHETPAQKKARIDEATTRRPRALSGWNIFQRMHFSNLDGQVCPERWKQEIKKVRETWANMPDDEKDAFKVQAAFEQHAREQLAFTPLVPKGAGPDEPGHVASIKALEEQVGRSGCKKLSARRLALNENLRQAHPIWQSATQLGDSALNYTLISLFWYGGHVFFGLSLAHETFF